jgi:hypothetical protein
MSKNFDIKQFTELGLLHELNRQFLHPVGLALRIRIEDDGTYVLDGITDSTDDPVGIVFGKLNYDKIEAVKKFQAERHKARLETTGFIIQTEDFK